MLLSDRLCGVVIIVFPELWLNLTRLAILLLTAFLGWVTYQSNLLLKSYQPNFNLLLSPPEFFVRVLLVGACLFLAWLSGLPADQLGLMITNPLWNAGLGLGIGIATQVCIYSLTWWAVNHIGRHIYSPIIIRSILPSRPAEWIPVSLALIPAVAMEELLFRTLWLGVFGADVSLTLLIVGTSVIFGLMHQPQGILGVVLTGSINVFFCLLFIWTGTLLVPLAAHYTINLLQLIVAYYQRDWLENY